MRQQKTVNFHENYSDNDEEIQGSSNKAFGFTVGGILVVLAGFKFYFAAALSPLVLILGLPGLLLITLGLIAPNTLKKPNQLWTKFGLLLFKIVNPVIMFLLYLITIIPAGLIMKMFGKDPLRRKFDPAAESYWIRREPPGPDPQTMINQF